mmetsp:Transcript_18642/g.33375  ORF Transcript_18642/g.33375 Transcript_18642/m.33375 type:complete len:552 (-) Transcript_18642:78-1733(-)
MAMRATARMLRTQVRGQNAVRASMYAGSVRLFSKKTRREGLGYDRRQMKAEQEDDRIDEELKAGMGQEDFDFQEVLDDGFMKDDHNKQVEDLMQLLNESLPEDDMQEEIDEGERIVDFDTADLTLKRDEKIFYDIDHVNFEKNAKIWSIQDADVPDDDLQLKRIPLAPPPDVRSDLEPDLVTADPIAKHNKQHIGMYYDMGVHGENMPKFFLSQMEREFHMARGKLLMVRQVGLDIAQEIKKANGQVMMIEGRRGHGKSGVSLYAALYAKEEGQLLLGCGLEDIGLWNDLKGRIETEPHEGLAYPSVFAMPDMSQRWFHWLRDTYPEEMKKITLKHDHGVEDYYEVKPWEDDLDQEFNPSKQRSIDKMIPEADREEKPTLYDLLNYGSQERTIAASLTRGVFEEIRDITEMKVCIVMDDFNSIIINRKERDSTKSDFVEPEVWKEIPRARLSLVDGFLSFVEKPPQNGSVIVTPTYSNHKKRGLERYKKYFVTKEFEVDRYNPNEHKNAFRHYSLSTALNPVIDWDTYPRVVGLTGRNPDELRKLTENGYY